MLRLRYVPIASLHWLHSFYDDNHSPDFRLAPTPTTRALLETYNWVARQTAEEFVLMGREDEPGVPTTPLDEPVVLTFVVTLKNSMLPNVSDWGAKGPFYFTNLNPVTGNPKPADGTTGAIPLTTGAVITPADKLPPIWKQRVSLATGKGTYKSLTVSRVEPGIGPKPAPKIPIAADLETLKIVQPIPGYYTLTWEKADGTAPVSETVYWSDELAAGPDFFGIVELFLDQTPAAPLAYTVASQHRNRVWRYVLIDAKSKLGPPADNPDLQVTYQSPGAGTPFPGSMVFQRIDPVEPADQELIDTIKTDDRITEVYLFQSADVLPILERSAPKMRLTYTGGSSALPVPTPETQNATLFFTI